MDRLFKEYMLLALAFGTHESPLKMTKEELVKRDVKLMIEKYDLQLIDIEAEYKLIKEKRSNLSKARREAVVLIYETITKEIARKEKEHESKELNTV